MRRILNIFSFALTMLLAGNTTAQVEEVRYALPFDASTSLYDCFLIIDKGETTTNLHKIQFNSQVSIIVPHGARLEVIDNFMPLIGHDTQASRNPIEWTITDIVSVPKGNVGSDYYSISPNITQTAFYNDMKAGDQVKLFSIKVKANGNNNSVRLYKNGVDNNITNTDLSNSFSLGGANQLIKSITLNEGNEMRSDANEEND